MRVDPSAPGGTGTLPPQPGFGAQGRRIARTPSRTVASRSAMSKHRQRRRLHRASSKAAASSIGAWNLGVRGGPRVPSRVRFHQPGRPRRAFVRPSPRGGLLAAARRAKLGGKVRGSVPPRRRNAGHATSMGARRARQQSRRLSRSGSRGATSAGDRATGACPGPTCHTSPLARPARAARVASCSDMGTTRNTTRAMRCARELPAPARNGELPWHPTPAEGLGPRVGHTRDLQTGKITGCAEFDATGPAARRLRGEGGTLGGFDRPRALESKPVKGPSCPRFRARPARPDESRGGAR